ncbi:nuclear transport factor 2 family protein [Marinovum sp.]|uniref:nuclear transport factor 2 family protein n=1 Tax=Marinovum sp. TaxID=2024839 RepID=UPI002B26C835|nr:nuclear transport factor 2 family protein [Marinovum sp.]
MIRPHDAATLADSEALTRLVTAYSRAIDRRDFDLLAALYLPEASDTHGHAFSGGVADYLAYLRKALSAYEATTHYVLQTHFEIDGDAAEGEVHKLNYHRTHGPDAVHVVTGSRSLDRYARRDGAWYFRARHVVNDWIDRRPAEEAH